MGRRLVAVSLAVAAALAAALLPLVTRVHATPVCAGPTYSAPPPCPRVFPEPAVSTNFIQFGPDSLGRSEFADGMSELQTRYPDYVKFEKLSDVLHDKNAVSIGADGIPPWDPKDTGDGLPVYVSEVTDFRVPDKDKAYVIITEAHSQEPCGREAAIRSVEDLAMWATDGTTTLDNGNGPENLKTTMTVADLLRKEHIFFMWISPDGWRSGDLDAPNMATEQQSNSRQAGPSQYGGIRFAYSEENGRGVNSNREAPSVGWMMRQPQGTYPNNSPGLNPVLTESEGIASWRFIEKILADHPLDAFMDIHGPLPLPAAIMLPDGQFDPHRSQLMEEMASRVKEKMDESVGQHVADPGLYDQLRQVSGGRVGTGASDWTTIGQAWDLLSYTVSGAWGFWMAQGGSAPTGIGTDYENNCVLSPTASWNGPLMQFFVDSARAAIQTTLVQAIAQRSVKTAIDPKGQIGYIYNPAVLTDKNNPTPPDANFPADTPGGNPYFPHGFAQYPYQATSMNYLADTSKYSTLPFRRVNPSQAVDGRTLSTLDTLVLVNNPLPSDATGTAADPATYYASLRSFVENGGNLVLTDGAIRALVGMGIISEADVKYGIGYVGYIDIQDTADPLVAGVPAQDRYPLAALSNPAVYLSSPISNRRETYDPVSIGYQMRAERDVHWASGTPDSQTHNMAPIWMVSRAGWEKLGGHTVATTDPLSNPTATVDEGTSTDKVSLGTLRLGKGRIVVFGAMLPDPTDKYRHPFGLSSYSPSYPAQSIFRQAITYSAGDGRSAAPSAVEAATTRSGSASTLPNTVAVRDAGGAMVPLALVGVLGAALAGRRRRRRSADAADIGDHGS